MNWSAIGAAAVMAVMSPTAMAQGYWYYCDPARAYYPYVRTCPTPWRAIIPNVTAPGATGSSPRPTIAAPQATPRPATGAPAAVAAAPAAQPAPRPWRYVGTSAAGVVFNVDQRSIMRDSETGGAAINVATGAGQGLFLFDCKGRFSYQSFDGGFAAAQPIPTGSPIAAIERIACGSPSEH
jgi:hypothetical protein